MPSSAITLSAFLAELCPFVLLRFLFTIQHLQLRGQNFITFICVFHSPLVYIDPLHSNLAFLFVQLCKDALNEYSYNAEIAGLKFTLASTAYGISVSTLIIIINPFPNKHWFLCVGSTSILKTLWEKEKLLVTSNFSFSRSVYYPFWRTFFHFYQI